jgi:hypothetical protein
MALQMKGARPLSGQAQGDVRDNSTLPGERTLSIEFVIFCGCKVIRRQKFFLLALIGLGIVLFLRQLREKVVEGCPGQPERMNLNDTRIVDSRSTCNRKKGHKNFLTLPLLCQTKSLQ